MRNHYAIAVLGIVDIVVLEAVHAHNERTAAEHKHDSDEELVSHLEEEECQSGLREMLREPFAEIDYLLVGQAKAIQVRTERTEHLSESPVLDEIKDLDFGLFGSRPGGVGSVVLEVSVDTG